MAIVLGLRFVCEMAALAAVAYWGQQAAGGVAGIVLAVIAVAVVAVVWGVFLAPRRRLEVGLPARLVIELAVWVAAASALWSAGQPTLAVVLFVVAVVTGAINARTAPTTAPG
ncbi:MAG TPA: YrdB family protein [Gaiellales bacterium]|nr:YrdB family protein [Gaiellales bacterium]